MRKAIVVAGGDKRFLDAIDEFQAYLRISAEVERIELLKTAYMAPPELAYRLAIAIGGHHESADPLLLAYAGHGGQEGWNISETVNFPYDTLTQIIAKSQRQLLVINDCCYAFALVDKFTEAAIPHERVSVIAACGTDELSYSGTLRKVFESWKQKKAYIEEEARQITAAEIYDIGYQEKTVGRFRHIAGYALHVYLPSLFPTVPRLKVKLLQSPGSRPCRGYTTRTDPTRRWGTRELDQFFFADRQLPLFAE